MSKKTKAISTTKQYPKNCFTTLLESSSNKQTDSWYDCKVYSKFKESSKVCKSETKEFKENEVSFFRTKKYTVYPTIEQKIKLNKWLNDCIKVYNMTNEYIKVKLDRENLLSDSNRNLINFQNLRKILNDQLREVCEKSDNYKHTVDYAVKHCVEMYKSAMSNIRVKHIKQFNVRNMFFNRRRKNLIIEPAAVAKNENKNGFFITQLGDMKIKDDLKFKDIIKQNSILQYDSYTKVYSISCPEETTHIVSIPRYEKCGIDIGTRTFATVIGDDACMEIGTNTYKIIDRYNKRIDRLSGKSPVKYLSKNKIDNLINKFKIKLEESKLNLNKTETDNMVIKYRKKLLSRVKTLSNGRKIKSLKKQRKKLSNYIEDLHNKVAKFLVMQYNEINIGKVNVKNMVANRNVNYLPKICKKRLLALSHFKFRMKLVALGKKWNCKINEVSEYKTSMTCSQCHNCQTIGTNKKFSCEKCKVNLDRDVNASINIYNNIALSLYKRF